LANLLSHKRKKSTTGTTTTTGKHTETITFIQSQTTDSDNISILSENSNPSPTTLTCGKIHKEISEEGLFISDETITMAVEVLRHTFEQYNIFLANCLVNIVINGCNYTLGWERFGRIFGSILATFTKPDGIYLIQIFSGNGASGH